MRLHVKLFGPQAALVGRREVEIVVLPPVTVAAVREALARTAPALVTTLGKSRFAVNQEFASDDQVVEEQDEVALIGMISGGRS